MDTITLTIPADWVEDLNLDQEVLRQALKLGLSQLRQQQMVQEDVSRVVQVLVSTGKIRHLAVTLVDETEMIPNRQPPPTLPGPPVSDILIAQRRGEL